MWNYCCQLNYDRLAAAGFIDKAEREEKFEILKFKEKGKFGRSFYFHSHDEYRTSLNTIQSQWSALILSIDSKMELFFLKNNRK